MKEKEQGKRVQFFVKYGSTSSVVRSSSLDVVSDVLQLQADEYAVCGSRLMKMESTLSQNCIGNGSNVQVLRRLRGGAGAYLDIPGQWECKVCHATRCWPARKRCYRCDAPRDTVPNNLPMGPLGRAPPQSRSSGPPTRSSAPRHVLPRSTVAVGGSAGDLWGRKGFRGGPLLDIHGSLQLLSSSHVRERDKGLLRSIMVGGVWNGFLLGRVRNQVVPCRFCGAPDHDGHLFWECTFPPLVEIRESPEFHDLMRLDKAHWPRCLLWHGWLPMLSGCNGGSPWAGTASESAHYLVEASLGGYSSSLVSSWHPPDGYHPAAVSCIVPDSPNVWTDGSLVLDKAAGVSSSGAGFFADHSATFWDVRTWGQVDHLQSSGDFPACRGFCSVPGPNQSVQRAEMWGVILALQSSGAVHLGVDNLGVVRHVGRLLDGRPSSVPFELLKDGDLLLLIDRMIRRRGPDTVRISKVKGHADEVMVRSGQVREVDRLGGRRRVSHAVIDARRNLSGVCNRWYPILLDLHRFFIAVSRAVVNHDDGPGTAPDPLVWSAGALLKRRRLVHAVRDQAFLPGPPGLWDSDWISIPASSISAVDIAPWPYTPGLLVKWVSFLASLHWPAGGSGLGVGGISYVELLILYELWAGERLSFEKAAPRYLRPERSISVSAVPFGPGIDIWRSCRFIGALMRSLCLLPGGLGRFVTCSIGANHCRLRHIGWEKCGRGLTSRPRESASVHFWISS